MASGAVAGQIAAERAFWMLTARGDTPRRLQMPNGQDPAEVLEHSGPTALGACLHDTFSLARHLLDERLGNLNRSPQTTDACAAIIAAQPPHTWAEQIEYVTARTNLVQGVVQQAVAGAAQRWTLDPLGAAQHQIGDLSAVRARLQQADLVLTADGAAKRRLHSGQRSEEPKPNGATALGAKTTNELARLEACRQLAHSIDSRLTTGQDWPILARAIQEADDAGYDVARELIQLATEGKLSTEHPAAELAYGLRATTQTFDDIEPSPGPDPKPAAVSSAARSLLNTPPSRRHPSRPFR